jgi:hypothetical protein
MPPFDLLDFTWQPRRGVVQWAEIRECLMSEAWMILAIAACAVVAAGLHLFNRRPAFANAREARLTRMVAQTVGCTLAQALPAVRREVDIAPHQSDETLIKRAAYHYCQELPERQGYVYRDQAPG